MSKYIIRKLNQEDVAKFKQGDVLHVKTSNATFRLSLAVTVGSEGRVTIQMGPPIERPYNTQVTNAEGLLELADALRKIAHGLK